MVKRYFPEAHIEACKGSISDNVSYVKKTGKWEQDDDKQEKTIEGTYEEFGSQVQLLFCNIKMHNLTASNPLHIFYLSNHSFVQQASPVYSTLA